MLHDGRTSIACKYSEEYNSKAKDSKKKIVKLDRLQVVGAKLSVF